MPNTAGRSQTERGPTEGPSSGATSRSLSGYSTGTGCGRSGWRKQVTAAVNGRYYAPCSKFTEQERSEACTIIDAPPFFESAGREEREPREKMDGEGEGSPPPRDSKGTMTTVFWGDDEGPVVMVWDGMTQGEQVITQTVISGEKDWVNG